MKYLDIRRFEKTEAQRRPFEFVVVLSFLFGPALEEANRHFPRMEKKAGNVAVEELRYGPGFASLIEEVRGAEFRRAVERKFDISLDGLQARVTVRGFSNPGDGEIHTDVRSKVLTGLIYLNESWDSDAGRLRLLRNGHDIEDYVAEVPPIGGTLLMFKRADNSWHGHKPFSGVRRTVQINWIDPSADKVSRGLALWGRRLQRAWSRLTGTARQPGI